IRYDRGVTIAQVQSRPVVETDSPAAEDIRNVFGQLDF
ncbi:(4Fe-4S)-binding protein, partial [bacterium]|nr:(4Fe-4S)-binding protein [bacterium]